MKKYLLPENGNFYKANLHCHSTNSDGKLTVEELKKIYMEKGNGEAYDGITYLSTYTNLEMYDSKLWR